VEVNAQKGKEGFVTPYGGGALEGKSVPRVWESSKKKIIKLSAKDETVKNPVKSD